MTAHMFSLLLTGWLLRDVCHCFVEVFSFYKYHIIYLNLRANFRRHILFFLAFFTLTGDMRKEKGGKRGKKKMDER